MEIRHGPATGQSALHRPRTHHRRPRRCFAHARWQTGHSAHAARRQRTGTNPEQLFAAGYSACFTGALKAVAARQKISLPPDVSVDAEVRFRACRPSLWDCRAHAHSSAGHGQSPGPVAGGCRAPSLSLFQRHRRQHLPSPSRLIEGRRADACIGQRMVSLGAQIKIPFKAQRARNIVGAVARQPQLRDRCLPIPGRRHTALQLLRHTVCRGKRLPIVPRVTWGT